MTRRATTLLICFVVIASLPASASVAGRFSGQPDQWDHVLADNVTVENRLVTLQAFQNDEHLFIHIKGQSLDQLTPTVYIDTGSTPFGYIMPFWAGTNQIDYKLTDDTLYYYDGNGFSEDWTEVGKVKTELTAEKMKIQVELSALGITVPRPLKIAAFSSADSILPESTNPMLLVTPSLNLTNINLSPSITVDGDLSDWEELEPLAHSKACGTSLFGAIVDETLYLAVKGKLSHWNDILINTDNAKETGHQSWIWLNMGANYLLENGILFRSTGPGWEWEEIASIPYVSQQTESEGIIEMALPLMLLEREKDATITIGFASSDVYIPAQGKNAIALKLPKSMELDAAQAHSSDQTYKLMAVRDEYKLYTIAVGTGLDLRNTYYISTGSSPGWNHQAWPSSKINYRVKNGVLERYSGEENGKPHWETISSVHIDLLGDAALMSFDLELLENYNQDNMSISFVNEAGLYLPRQGETMMRLTQVIHQPRDENAFYPREIYDVLNNPFMGWVPWATNGSVSQPHRLVYAGISWRELEPVRGQFAWDEVEAKYLFDYWTERGVKFVMRIVLDTPTRSQATIDIPDWLYELTGGAGTWYNTSEIGNGFSPDYRNPVFFEEHARMIAELGKRYNNDPRIAFIQLGSLGHWGEWHTWPSGSGVFPEIAVSDLYVQHYLDAFPDKMIGMRRPFKIARDNKLGLFNDMFGDKRSTDEWINWFEVGINELEPAMPDFWKYAFSGGEFANGNALMHLTDEKIADTLRQARESHTSWLGPCSPADAALEGPQQANLDIFVKTIGYRFVLDSVIHSGQGQIGQAYPIAMNWQNKGVAPFYFPWALELALADQNGNIRSRTKTNADIRTWLPGSVTVETSIDIPADLEPGQYTLLVGIIDPETNEPGVDLAIAGRRPDGWYELNGVEVR